MAAGPGLAETVQIAPCRVEPDLPAPEQAHDQLGLIRTRRARQGLSEEQCGWLYLPLTAGIISASLLAKRLLDRWPYDRIVAAGIACFVIGGCLAASVLVLGLLALSTCVPQRPRTRLADPA